MMTNYFIKVEYRREHLCKLIRYFKKMVYMLDKIDKINK